MAPQKNIAKKPKSTGRIKTSGVRRHRYGLLVAVIFLVLIIAAGIIGYKLIKSFNESPSKKSDDAAKIDTHDDSKNSSDVEESQDPKGTESHSDPDREKEKANPQYEGDNPNNSATLTGIINYIGAADDTFMVRVAIDQTISTGTCNFILTSPSGQTYNFSSETTSGPSSTYCSLNTSFSNLKSEFGTWKVSATIKDTTGGKAGTITGEGAVNESR